jgi:hypothetical protein
VRHGHDGDPVRDVGLTRFLTGLGTFQDRTDGVPWQFNPSDNREASINAIFGIPDVGMYSPPLTVSYAGPAPLLAGVDQVNVGFSYFPNMLTGVGQAMASEGCRVPLYLTNETSASQIVNVSIHRNGETCSDSPVNTLGIVTWKQNVVSDVGNSSASTGIGIQFLQGNGLSFPQPPAVRFFSPFSNARYFLPWRPIVVSSIGVAEFFSESGLHVLRSEFKWIWLPAEIFAILALAVRRRRMGHGVGNEAA